MNRRTLGRGRLIVAIGGVVMLLASLFPWGQTAGIGLPPQRTGAFDGFGIVVFLGAVALLMLIALPYAAGDQPVGIDRPVTFAIVAAVAVGGFVLKLVQIWQDDLMALPDRSLGMWLAGIGLALVAWGVAEMAVEPRPQ